MECLEELGLHKIEAKIYLALHTLGESTANRIAKTTGIHVRSVYDRLETLVGRGLLTVIEMDGTHYYSTAGLGAFTSYLEERKRVLEKLDQLLSHSKPMEEPIVRVFRGVNGARALLEEKLRERKTVFYYGANASLLIKYPLIMEKWNRQREEHGFKVKALAINQPNVLSLIKKARWETRIVPETSLTPWWKFGDNVVFPVWELADPIFIYIKNKSTARTHEYMFNSLWEKAKRMK